MKAGTSRESQLVFHVENTQSLKILFSFLAMRIIYVLLHSKFKIGCVAQLNRASDYGSEGFRFES